MRYEYIKVVIDDSKPAPRKPRPGWLEMVKLAILRWLFKWVNP